MTVAPPGGYRQQFFEQLAAIEEGHYWFESRNRLIVWALRRYFPEATSFLEVGCGTGFVLQGIHAALPAVQLIATDSMSEGLEFARRRVPRATLIQRDARNLAVSVPVDVAGAFDVIEHIPEDERVLAEIFRATRPGGGAMIAVPQHPELWSSLDEVSQHVRRYRRRELVDKMERAGFEVIRATSFVSVLLPFMAMARWMGRRQSEDFDARRELTVAPIVNAALRLILTLERAAIQLGVSWPAGGSLLVIARKPAGPSM
jgi:SAM-dependent methyltransferase